jgi:hypothetical protein
MMKDVLRECDRGQNFDSYAYCIKSTYNKNGNNPNHAAVRAFYANLDMISEAYSAKKITDAQAKSYAYDSFMRTIQASNDRDDAVFMNQMNAMQQQQLLQEQLNQRRVPVQTNCVRNGAHTNCTSY